MSDVDVEDQDVAVSDGAKGTRRVIERAIMVPIGDLPEDAKGDVRVVAGFVKMWAPVAVRSGKDAEAIDAYADAEVRRPGEYRALPKTTWDGARGRVIEPELR